MTNPTKLNTATSSQGRNLLSAPDGEIVITF